MKSNTGERPAPDKGNEAQEDSDSSNKGDHAKVGFPGKLQAARTAAPDSATDERINEVAWEAHRRGVDPATIWGDGS